MLLQKKKQWRLHNFTNTGELMLPLRGHTRVTAANPFQSARPPTLWNVEDVSPNEAAQLQHVGVPEGKSLQAEHSRRRGLERSIWDRWTPENAQSAAAAAFKGRLETCGRVHRPGLFDR